MKLKGIFSILLIACLCALSIFSISVSAASEIELLRAAISHLKEDVDELQTTVGEYGTLKEEVEQDLELLRTSIADIEADIASLYEFDAANEVTFNSIDEKITKLEDDVKLFESSVNDKIAALEAKDKELADKDASLEAKDKELADKDASLEAKDKELADKDASLEAKDKELADKDASLEAKIKELEEKIAAIESAKDEAETENAVEKTVEKSEEDVDDASTGCGASVAISALVTVCAIGTAVVLKKKD